MTTKTKAAIDSVRGGLDELLAAIPGNLPSDVVAEQSCEILLLRLTSCPPTRSEMALVGLLAAALARLKELERL